MLHSRRVFTCLTLTHIEGRLIRGLFRRVELFLISSLKASIMIWEVSIIWRFFSSLSHPFNIFGRLSAPWFLLILWFAYHALIPDKIANAFWWNFSPYSNWVLRRVLCPLFVEFSFIRFLVIFYLSIGLILTFIVSVFLLVEVIVSWLTFFQRKLSWLRR